MEHLFPLIILYLHPMKNIIQYIIINLLIFGLFTKNIHQLLGMDNCIIIEYIEFENDPNEEKNITQWKDFFSKTPLQQFIKQKVLYSFYINTYHPDYIHNIITPPPQL